MKRLLTSLLLFLASCNFIFAQQNLTASRTSSYYKYIYKLTDREAHEIASNPILEIKESFLHTVVDSFYNKPGGYQKKLPFGNYLYVTADKNKLKYESVSVANVRVAKVSNNNDFQFVVMDLNGKLIEDAEVKIGKGRHVPFDKKANLYLTSLRSKESFLTVVHDGVKNYFRINPGYVQKRNPKSSPVQKKTTGYTGYLTFNKPKFKPGDTVRFKAYLVDKNGKPLHNKLLAFALDEDEVIDSIKPYNEGGYEGSFVLADSLDLSLDQYQRVFLKEKIKGEWETVFSNRFYYEDYELKSTRFSVRSNKNQHTPGNPIVLYLKAVDENELAVPDGRVDISIVKPYKRELQDEYLFLKDTLWKKTIVLDPVGETKLVLPDSIFPKSDIRFTMILDFFNSNNEKSSEEKYFSYANEKKEVIAKIKADSIYFDYVVNDKSEKKKVTLYTFFEGNDKSDSVSLVLPASLKIDQNASEYEAKTEDGNKYVIRFGRLLQPNIYLNSKHTRDSLQLSTVNDSKLNFWYTIFSDNKVILKGYTNKLDTLMKFKGTKAAHIVLSYIWRGQTLSQNTSAWYNKQSVYVDLKAPRIIYPGQTVNMEVKVMSQENQPVGQTDLTALAYTSKFTDKVQDILLPTFGDVYKTRKTLPDMDVYNVSVGGEMDLNWSKWGKELGLDTIAYYQFTHPKEIYTNVEPVNDSMAVVSPFVIKNGEIAPVNVVYIDDIPVYYGGSDQLKRYAFRVTPGPHRLRLNGSGFTISYDGDFLKGKRTVLGIQADLKNTKARVSAASSLLTVEELLALEKYVVYIRDNFEGEKTTISTDKSEMLLNMPPQVEKTGNLLIGPIAENQLRFKSGSLDHLFVKEQGYVYSFFSGLVRQKSSGSKNLLYRLLMPADLSEDYKKGSLKQGEIDSIWNDYLDLRSSTTRLYENKEVEAGHKWRLSIEIDTTILKQLPYLKNVIIYKNDDYRFLQIYPGRGGYDGNLNEGSYRVMYLFKDNRYFVKDDVIVKAGGSNLYRFKQVKIMKADSLSIRMDRKIKALGRKDTRPADYFKESAEVVFNSGIDKKLLVTRIRGTVFDAGTKETMVGVSIAYKGKNRAARVIAQTNSRGVFDVMVPKEGEIWFSYISYKKKVTKIRANDNLIVLLNESPEYMQEVVIRGYSAKRENGGDVGQLLQGKVAGINIQQNTGAPGMRGTVNIRGLNTNSSLLGTGVLIIVDGLPYSGDINSIDPNSIVEMEVLKDKAATDIYGSAGANGVIVIKTNGIKLNMEADGGQQPQQQTMRSNFSDYAVWQPKLFTDEQGKASFTVKFPDDITSWTTKIIAMNGRQQSGSYQTEIKSFKTLSANFVSPLFALTGDSIDVIGKLMNYSNASERVNRKLIYNGKELLNSDFDFKNAHLDTVAIVAQKNNANTDSLQFQYTMEQTNGYFDGEVRKIPLYPLGVVETKGYFNALTTDTTVNYKFDANLGKVTLRAESSVFPILLDEMEKLRNYEYFCNEQLASKLKGLLLEKTVRKYLNEDFKGEKNIKDLIRKLQNNSRPEGTWGWWQNSNTEYWISLHVVEALLEAQKQGYDVSINRSRLHNSLVERLAEKNAIDQIQAIKLMRLLDEKYYIKDWLTTIDQQKSNESQTVYDKLQIMQLKQKAGLDVDVKWLLAQKKNTIFGNSYWGEENNRFWDNSIQNTLLAYQILKEKGGYKDELVRIQQYFLEQRKDGQWRNTFESSLILETILPELLARDKKSAPAAITLNNSETITVFPFTKVVDAKALMVNKKGNDPVYFTAYQQFNNPKPDKVSKDFTVKTWFEQNAKVVQKLKAGTATTLKIEVDVRADADYVMIEVPIPAGCSYENKMQSFSGVETHREYFKNKTAIFCTKLKQGKHSFSISLMPRYSGSYALNPAKAEMMYFPVFYGREGMKRVEVK